MPFTAHTSDHFRAELPQVATLSFSGGQVPADGRWRVRQDGSGSDLEFCVVPLTRFNSNPAVDVIAGACRVGVLRPTSWR